jgi:hypothetical protein
MGFSAIFAQNRTVNRIGARGKCEKRKSPEISLGAFALLASRPAGS